MPTDWLDPASPRCNHVLDTSACTETCPKCNAPADVVIDDLQRRVVAAEHAAWKAQLERREAWWFTLALIGLELVQVFVWYRHVHH